MTLDELMKKYKGEWQDDRAVIYGPDGYYWCVANKVGGVVKVTTDGARYGLSDTAAAARTVASKAPLAKHKTPRKSDLTSGLDDLITGL